MSKHHSKALQSVAKRRHQEHFEDLLGLLLVTHLPQSAGLLHAPLIQICMFFRVFDMLAVCQYATCANNTWQIKTVQAK